MKRFLIAFSLAAASIAAMAWQPTKPITVIYPNGPGAGNEISFKIVSDIVEKNTGAKFVSEHRPGVDGNIATNHFATVANDGYTVAVPACQSQWVTAEIWYPQMIKYNILSVKDHAPDVADELSEILDNDITEFINIFLSSKNLCSYEIVFDASCILNLEYKLSESKIFS